jgi:MFS family permease
LIIAVSIFAGPLAGYIADRYWKRRYWMLCAWAAGRLLYIFPFNVTGWMIPALLVAMGILTAPIVPPSFASVLEIVGSPKLAGMGMGVMALG